VKLRRITGAQFVVFKGNTRTIEGTKEGPQRTTEEESSSVGSVVETPILRRILTRPIRSKLPREINLATLP